VEQEDRRGSEEATRRAGYWWDQLKGPIAKLQAPNKCSRSLWNLELGKFELQKGMAREADTRSE